MSELLPTDVQDFVKQALATGDYASEEEVLVAGVRALRELTQRHAALRADIQIGIDELDRGEGTSWDGDAIKAELDRQLDASQQDS